MDDARRKGLKNIGHNAIDRARDEWGDGWKCLSDRQRNAEIATHVIDILNAQDESMPEYDSTKAIIEGAGL